MYYKDSVYTNEYNHIHIFVVWSIHGFMDINYYGGILWFGLFVKIPVKHLSN